MRNRARSVRARVHLRAQHAFSLVELLISLLLLTIVLGAAISVLATTYDIAPDDIERTHQVQETRTSVYRMTRELRQATTLTMIDGYRMYGTVTLNGTVQNVLWRCDQSNTCTRETSASAIAATSTAGIVQIRNLRNQVVSPNVPVFTNPTTDYYQVQIQVRSIGARKGKFHTVVFRDGFYGRNS
jgi:prepilin-type N-terminal cleavage/methylation domain-containing protein